MDISIFRDPNRPSWLSLAGMFAADDRAGIDGLRDNPSKARPVAAAQGSPSPAAAAQLEGARARAAHFAEIMRTPSRVAVPVQPSNVAAPWSEIVARVEAEQPRNAMTLTTAADPHGWSQIFAAVAAENAVSSTRPGGSNHGWDEAFLNAKS